MTKTDPQGLWFEDLKVGVEFTTVSNMISDEEVRQFGQGYDPQPLHVDADQATKCGPFGGIVASGFHTLGISWRQWVNTGIPGNRGAGGIGMDDCRWLRPVFPGDTIHSRVRVEESRVTSKGKGLIRLSFSVRNQCDQEVMRYSILSLVKRRTDTAKEEKGYA